MTPSAFGVDAGMRIAQTLAGIATFAVVLVLSGACSRERSDHAVWADAVYRNGRVYTVDADRSWAEAVAIAGGRIVYVGSSAGAAGHVGPATTVVDLEGRLMLPGFQDAHIHPIGAGVEALACDLNDLEEVAQYRAAVAAYAAAHPDTPWILGGGWSMAAFGPGAMASRVILDELVPDRPVYLSSRDGHTGWANSAALAIAGITRDTPDPADGRIDREPGTGEPIGSLQEGAMKLVTRHVPPETLETKVAGLQFAVTRLNGYGITSIQDASVDEDALEAYKVLEDRGGLSLRVVAALWWDRDRDMGQVPELIALRDRYTGGLIDARTVKIFQDGVIENYTAALLEPYLVPSGTRGMPMVEPELLKRIVTRLDAAGFQAHFHAIGDAAVRQCLDAVEAAVMQNGRRGHRHHIAHLQLIDPADLPRFGELEVVANFQPLWAYADDYITELTIPFIGERRARWLYPIRSVIDSGGTVAFGSDWSVSTPNPFLEIETAITRQDPVGEATPPLIPEERIDLATAIAAFTVNAAFVNRRETETGSIVVGKLADLVVLDQNLFEVRPEEISETKVLLTLFAGRPVHGDATRW